MSETCLGPGQGNVASGWVGREDVLAQVDRCLTRVDPRSRKGLFVIGEPGIGKTRCLEAACSRHPGLVRASAAVGDRLVPYSSLARWLRAIDRAAPDAADTSLRPSLSFCLPAHPAAPQAAGTADPLPPTAHAVLRLLQRAQPRISAWALDNLQWADEASVDLLRELIEVSPPASMPWLIASTPLDAVTEAHALHQAALALPGVQTLTLARFGREELFDLLMAMGPQGLPATRAHLLAEQLMRPTGGHPLHARLAIAWVVDAPGGAGGVVPPLGGLIGQRLGQASAAALELARAAAVAGQDFCAALAMHATGRSAEDLDALLLELEQLGLMQGVQFVHERMREVTRQATPDFLAEQLHGACAEWLQAQDGEPARIAAHWRASADPARALPALRQAAERARALHCVPERIACLTQAATLAEACGRPDEAFDAWCEAFEAHTEAIRRTEGAPLLDHIQRLARSSRQQARASAHRAWYALVQGRLDEARALGEQALEQAFGELDEDLAAPARLVLGTVLGLEGRLGRARELLEAAEPALEARLQADERASFLGNLGSVLDNLGQHDEARKRHQKALSLANRHAGAAQRATLLANYALSRLEAGDPLGARELAQKAQALVDTEPSAAGAAGFVAVLMAPCERTLGRYAAALDWCQRAETLLAHQGPARMPVAQLQRAHVWLDLGQHERALELLDGAGRLLGQQLPARHAVRWLLLLARAQRRCGLDPRAALADARERLPAEGWPGLALELRAESALLMDAASATAELGEVALAAAGQGLQGTALGAWLRAAWCASEQPVLAAEARTAADTALALMGAGVETIDTDRSLRWLAPARALALFGEAQRAHGLLLRGQQWLQLTLGDQVPSDSKDAFATRHPLNRQLAQGPTARGP